MTGVRLRIIAFVCEGGVIHTVQDEGFSSFGRVFRSNPAGCRWVVTWGEGEYRVYDLDDVMQLADGDFTKSFHPGKYHVFACEEAALAAAALLPARDS
jgi:hypothetical protein